MNFTEKKIISKQLKNISYDEAIIDFHKLKNYKYKNTKSLVGTKCVDFFTFTDRLNTLSKKNINFYEFYKNINEFKQQNKYIQNFFKYYELKERKGKNNTSIIYDCFRLYYGSIGSFFPSVAVRIYNLYNPTTILDPFSGWGGRLIGAMSQNINYIGYDTNTDLHPAYDNIINTLSQFTENKTYNIIIKPAETADFSKLYYDMVFTSPPYYNIELYTGTNRKDKTDWNELYKTVFKNTYDNLQTGGHFILSINIEMYDKVCVPLLGEATEIIKYVKSRNGKYTEFIYVWKKL